MRQSYFHRVLRFWGYDLSQARKISRHGDFDVSGNRERAAYHEAGHCAAAIAFGIPIIAPSKPMRDTCTMVIIETSRPRAGMHRDDVLGGQSRTAVTEPIMKWRGAVSPAIAARCC
jgi:hypothetical protein